MSNLKRDIDKISTGLGAYKITTFDPTVDEYYTYYPELKRAKQQIINLIESVVPEAKLQLIRDIKNSEGYGKMPIGMRDLLSDMSDKINKEQQDIKSKLIGKG